MTKGIEKSLNLKPLKEIIEEENPALAEDLSQQDHGIGETEETSNLPAEQSAPANFAAPVREEEHDGEMNDISEKALKAHNQIFTVAQNVNPERSARLFEVAGQYLKMAMDSSNSKVDRQVQVAKLKILSKKLNAQDDFNEQLKQGKEIIMDRNHLLKQLLKENQDTEVIDAESSSDEEGKQD